MNSADLIRLLGHNGLRGAFCATLSLSAWGCVTIPMTAPRVVSSVEVTPASLSFTSAGSFDSFTATVMDQDGRPMLGVDVDWSTSDPSVATVNGNGGVTSQDDGFANITATAEGVSAVVEVTVAIPVLEVDFMSITVGGDHSCAITTLNDAYCWGVNTYFQLGDGFSQVNRNKPVEVDYFRDFRVLSAGRQHTCALVANGAANLTACWGRSDVGQVGQTGPSGVVATPRLIQGQPSNPQSVASGDKHACVVGDTGEARCWANNSNGQVGDGSTVLQFTATPVLGGHTFQSIAASGNHTCGVTTDGDAYCWGENDSGQLGDGSNTDSSQPVLVSGGLDFAAVSGNCGLTTGGAAYCWGANASGQLGNGSSSASNVPVAVSGGHTFQTLVSGEAFNCGLTAAGEAWCWGENGSGQLGNGSNSNSNVPVQLSGGLTLQSIATSISHACAVATDAEAYCWGDNSSGQLGDGTNTASNVPVRVIG